MKSTTLFPQQKYSKQMKHFKIHLNSCQSKNHSINSTQGLSEWWKCSKGYWAGTEEMVQPLRALALMFLFLGPTWRLTIPLSSTQSYRCCHWGSQEGALCLRPAQVTWYRRKFLTLDYICITICDPSSKYPMPSSDLCGTRVLGGENRTELLVLHTWKFQGQMKHGVCLWSRSKIPPDSLCVHWKVSGPLAKKPSLWGRAKSYRIDQVPQHWGTKIILRPNNMS